MRYPLLYILLVSQITEQVQSRGYGRASSKEITYTFFLDKKEYHFIYQCYIFTFSKQNYTEDIINKMLEFLMDKIFVAFFQQDIGIQMGIRCALLLADMFLLFIGSSTLLNLQRTVAESFNTTYRYIYDALNNSKNKIVSILLS